MPSSQDQGADNTEKLEGGAKKEEIKELPGIKNGEPCYLMTRIQFTVAFLFKPQPLPIQYRIRGFYPYHLTLFITSLMSSRNPVFTVNAYRFLGKKIFLKTPLIFTFWRFIVINAWGCANFHHKFHDSKTTSLRQGKVCLSAWEKLRER